MKFYRWTLYLFGNFGTGSVVWDVTKPSQQRIQGFTLKLKYLDFEAQMVGYVDPWFGAFIHGSLS
jgi:hypothetical protein